MPVSDPTEQTPPLLQLGGKDIYNEDAEDTEDLGGAKDQSFLERLGIALRCFPSFCPRDHPESVKTHVGEIGPGPAVMSLTGVACAIGHASSLLGGAVFGIAVGLGVVHAMSLMEDTNIRLGRIGEHLEDIESGFEGIRDELKDWHHELEVFGDKLEEKLNRTTIAAVREVTSEKRAQIQARDLSNLSKKYGLVAGGKLKSEERGFVY